MSKKFIDLSNSKLKQVGVSADRMDGLDKVTGSAKYLDDLQIGPMLYVKVKKSPIAHGRIINIDTSEAEKLTGVKGIVTGKEFPNLFGLYLNDRAAFAIDKVRYWGEPVAAVAATSIEVALEAIELIKVEYEELPSVHDPVEAMKPDAPLVHENLGDYELVPIFYPKPGTNISNHFKARKGDMDKGFAEADFIMENEYKVPHMQHATIETHKAAALWEGDRLTVWSTAQSPSTLRQILGKALDMPLHKIRVISSYIGGGFGGKAGATMEGIVIPLAKKCPGKVVRLSFTREEDIQGSFVRQALVSKVKMGVRNDGRVTALEFTMYWDGGAYTEYGVNITRAAGYSSTGAYEIENVKTDSYCIYTNNPVGGPVRGFGMPEMQWALERQMDEIAKKLNMDPLDVRLVNAMRDGSKTVTGQVVYDVAYDECLKKVAAAIDWGKKEGKYRGKGIAGSVKAPAQPSNAASSAIIRFNEDSTIHLMFGATEMGQGALTVLSQIAAEALNQPVEKVIARTPDTDFTPYEWQSVASRTTYSTGRAIIAAAEDAKKQIYQIASIALDVPETEIEIDGDEVRWIKNKDVKIELQAITSGYKKKTGEGVGGMIIGRGTYVPSKLTNLNPETGEGSPGLFWTFGAQAMEVEVDPETGEVKILQLASAVDAGKAINPLLCKAQLNGGTIMGLGTALYEELKIDKGRVMNPNFTDYKIPTIQNIPDIKGFILETPETGGPYGARGIGEPVMIPTAPALANAVADALGVDFITFPLTPERIVQAIKDKEQELSKL